MFLLEVKTEADVSVNKEISRTRLPKFLKEESPSSVNDFCSEPEVRAVDKSHRERERERGRERG